MKGPLMTDFVVGKDKKEFQIIQEAVDAAQASLEGEGSIAVVLIKPGLYEQSINLPCGVKLLGVGGEGGGFHPKDLSVSNPYSQMSGWHPTKIVGGIYHSEGTHGTLGISGIHLEGTFRVDPTAFSGGPLRVSIVDCFMRRLLLLSLPEPIRGYALLNNVSVWGQSSLSAGVGWNIDANNTLLFP